MDMLSPKAHQEEPQDRFVRDPRGSMSRAGYTNLPDSRQTLGEQQQQQQHLPPHPYQYGQPNPQPYDQAVHQYAQQGNQYIHPGNQYAQQDNQYAQQGGQHGQFYSYPPPPFSSQSAAFGLGSGHSGPGAGKLPLPGGAPPVIVADRKWQDPWAVVLFVLCLGVFIFAACIGIPVVVSQVGSGDFGIVVVDLAYVIGVVLVVSVGFVAIWFVLLQKFPRQMIKISYWAFCALLVAAAVLMLCQNALPGYITGFFCLVIAGLYAWFYFYLRTRIPFASVLLETVTRISSQFPAAILTGLLGVILSLCFQFVWIFTSIGIFIYAANGWSTTSKQPQGFSPGAIFGLMIGFVFILYWTQQVIYNTVYVICSGLYATVYFTGTQVPGSTKLRVGTSNPTAKSAARALTTSFGSICFGSLLISILQTLRFISGGSQSNSPTDLNSGVSFIGCCCQCLFMSIGDVICYFNRYAFTHMAIYGTGYCESGKATWGLFQARGIEVLINDNIIGRVIGLGSFSAAVIGSLTALAAAVINKNIPQSPETFMMLSSYGMVVGFTSFFSMMCVIKAGVSATYVCIAEDPATMEKLRPELFERLRETWPSITWGLGQA
ncbi:plasma-membrane choline transporter-domain-containing protein [Polychytrium aggregatum]|uniref:plasma-membrane choline transporter-domain-containing protein n=1 Tax=Polychytrium aggregatum TaxID=110093 RepID=UPI0022FDCB22|nr:plasma-membrane choline transporter-domain-containing protein [Polychytrium aggregatum]KAI9202849.1 plasma-membrane choline transporter-domain-containing protein [Polychytrium aggregatum]